MRLAVFIPCVSALIAGCGSRAGDAISVPVPGTGPDCRTDGTAAPNRIECQRDPKSPSRQNPATSPVVTIDRAVIVAIDGYDETRDGKARGAIYVQDVGSSAPHAGVSLYRPSLLPASAVPAIGDVYTLAGGKYQENTTIGTTVTFPAGQYLPQISYASGTFAFEFVAPAPAQITPFALGSWSTGEGYVGMLVTVKGITIDTWKDDGKGRITGTFAPGSAAASISNELMALDDDVKARRSFKSVTGVVTYFYSLHVAPRSRADIEF